MNCTTDEIIEKTLDEIKERFQTNPDLQVVLKNTGEVRQLVDYNGNVFVFNFGKFATAKSIRTPFEIKKMVDQLVADTNAFLVQSFDTNSASGYLSAQKGTENISVVVKMPAPLEAKYRQMEIEYWKDVDETREALREEYGRPEEYMYNPDEEEYNANEEDDYGSAQTPMAGEVQRRTATQMRRTVRINPEPPTVHRSESPPPSVGAAEPAPPAVPRTSWLPGWLGGGPA